MITAAILVVGCCITRFTEFAYEYGSFLLYMLALYRVAKLCRDKKVKHIRLFYYLSITPIMFGGIMLGTFLDPHQPAITIMILLCVMTLFIIDEPAHIICYLVANALIFVICCYIAKPLDMFLADLNDLLIYLSISIGIMYFTLKDRVESAVNYCMVQSKSEHDTLTSLLNRGSGEMQSRELVEQKIEGTFAIIDVDDFKLFNDQYGHQMGDEVICSLAQHLKSAFRDKDIIFRLGGDEFAVYAPGLTDPHLCEQHFEKLQKSLQKVDMTLNKDHSIQVSIGCAIYKSGNVDFETLYKKSDELLYEAKEKGKGQVIIDMI